MADDIRTQEHRRKATTIGHSDHVFLSPLSNSKADWLIDLLDLSPHARVLDIACGKAGFLRRLLKRRPTVEGVGVDINAEFLASAARGAASDGVADRLTLVEQPAEQFLTQATLFDAVLCFGGSQAVGGFDALGLAARWALPPGGLILVGEGYWRTAPSPAYLAVLGATVDELTDHPGLAVRLRAAGFEILATSTANFDEWDEYEGLYCRAKTRWALSNFDDPDAANILEDARKWHDAYLRWGRDTLGFGWYLAAAV